MIREFALPACVAVLSAAAGCARQSSTAPAAGHGPSAEGQAYVLSMQPPEAQSVIATRERAGKGEEVTVIGRIGGSVDPWIEGRAAFSLVDQSLAACSDIPGDNCPTPWDYCCVTDKLPTATALVKVVDGEGKLVPIDARTLLGLRELQTVVVKGKAERDEAGNLTILASGIFAHARDPGRVPPEQNPAEPSEARDAESNATEG